MTWSMIAYVSMAVAVFITIINIILSIHLKKKNRLGRSVEAFFEDYKLSEYYDKDHHKHHVFRPQSSSMDKIAYYSISYEAKHAVLLCRFNESIENLKMKVYAYSQYKELVDIYLVEQTGDFLNTPKIMMSPDVSYVNIEVLEESYPLDIEKIIDKRKSTHQWIAVLSSFALSFYMVAATYAIIFLVDKKQMDKFLIKENYSLLLMIFIAISLIHYLLFMATKKKWRKGV